MLLKSKIINLWLVLVVGSLLHALLGMLPLYFGQSIAVEGATAEGLGFALWFTVLINVVPLALIVAIQSGEPSWLRWLNFMLAAILFVLNLTHPMELIGSESIDWPQLVQMLFMIVASAMLAKLSWGWAKGASV